MTNLRFILAIVAVFAAAWDVSEKDYVGLVMWSGIFFLNMFLYILESLKIYIENQIRNHKFRN